MSAWDMSLRDHSYYRCFEPGIDSDQFNGQLLTREGSVQLSALEPTRDSFETILVCLLRAYARNTGADNEEISPEALSTLSQDQLQSLVTSNTVHYDVIQQILIQKQKDGTFTAPAGYDELSLQTPPATTEQLQNSVVGAAVTPLPSEQLKEIQIQVNELIRNHQVPIPPDASLDQQQMIIHNYILSHFALLQHQAQRKLGGQETIATPVPISDPLTMSGLTATKLIPQDTMPLSPDLQGTAFNPHLTKNTATPVQAAFQANISNQSAMTVGELTDLVGSSHGRVGMERGRAQASGVGTHKWAGPNQELNIKTRGRKDFEELKKPPSIFNLYFSNVSQKVLEANPGITFGELSKAVNTMWIAASQQEKAKYYAQYEQLVQAHQAVVEKQQSEERYSDPSPLPGAQSLPSEEEEEEDEAEWNRREEQQARAAPMHCLLGGCSNMAVFSEDRGHHYCSNECLVKHARLGFQAWVAQRKAKA